MKREGRVSGRVTLAILAVLAGVLALNAAGKSPIQVQGRAVSTVLEVGGVEVVRVSDTGPQGTYEPQSFDASADDEILSLPGLLEVIGGESRTLGCANPAGCPEGTPPVGLPLSEVPEGLENEVFALARAGSSAFRLLPGSDPNGPAVLEGIVSGSFAGVRCNEQTRALELVSPSGEAGASEVNAVSIGGTPVELPGEVEPNTTLVTAGLPIVVLNQQSCTVDEAARVASCATNALAAELAVGSESSRLTLSSSFAEIVVPRECTLCLPLLVNSSKTGSVVAPDRVAFAIEIENSGCGAAYDVVVTDRVPQGLFVDPATVAIDGSLAPQGAVSLGPCPDDVSFTGCAGESEVDPSRQCLIVRVGDLGAGGESAEVAFEAAIDPESCDRICNNAVIGAEGFSAGVYASRTVIMDSPAAMTDADADGYSTCTGDCDDFDAGTHPGGQEICNGKDEDCNGATDDGLGQTTCGVASCEKTVENCVDGVERTCDPFEGATSEVCDGADNDCDGTTDEGLGQSTCGTGACERTVDNCAGGIPQTCTPGPASPEVCDGADNDCDGTIDENLGQTTCGTGACERTVDNCANGAPQACTPGSPATEVCGNEADEDCDGDIDDADLCAPPANRPPVAADDAYDARFGETLAVPAPGVLENDTDPDGDPLTAEILEAPEIGTFAFDTDGSFSYTREAPSTTPGGLDPLLEWSWTGSPVEPTFRQVMVTPIVANLNDDNGDGRIDADDVPDVVFATIDTTSTGTCGRQGILRAVSGADGTAIFDVTDPSLRVRPCIPVAIGDLDGDGVPEIVASLSDRLVILEHDGAFRRFSAGLGFFGSPSLADLDRDGAPEIVVGATVLDRDGNVRFSHSASVQGGFGTVSTTADLDLDGDLEVVTGFQAYHSDGRVFYSRSGGGHPAVGNFDDDANPEIVVVSSGNVWLLEHNGTTKWGPVAIPSGGGGGPPTVADFDGDGLPEIGVAGASRYAVFETDGSLKWAATVRDTSSNVTGSSVFDFDGDGKAEVVYNDELRLRIFDGTTGQVLFETPNPSGTAMENPIVVDVDNDGHAEIVVCRNQVLGFGGAVGVTDQGIFVYGGSEENWIRTRRIWNQHSYHITNIGEDGAIPVGEPPNWLVSDLNNFRTNAFLPDEAEEAAEQFTYKASDGALDSNTATVRIRLRPRNSAPEIISTPPTTAFVAIRYSYAVRVKDPDPGEQFTFSLPVAPAGMTISSLGAVDWTPASNQLGAHEVQIRVEDRGGLAAYQVYTVTVAIPDPLDVDDDGDGFSENEGDCDDTDASRYPGATDIPGDGIDQDCDGADADAADFDDDGDGFSENEGDCDDSDASRYPGATDIPGDGIDQDCDGADADAADFDDDGDGFSENQGDCDDTDASRYPGATDIPGDGIDQDCNGADAVAGDSTPPTVAIDLPVDLAEITSPTELVGTADDPNLLRYVLALAPVDAPALVPFFTGTTRVVDDVLGQLDPTLLENGMYRVRLTAEDANGQKSSVERIYLVTGEQKVGVFRISFLDLNVPVAGVPIQVVRTYDSRKKTGDDFGIGWSLDVRAGSYRHNRKPGLGWQFRRGGGFLNLPCQGIDETLTHLTEFRLSDREVYRFGLKLQNPVSIFGGCLADASFEFVDGSIPGATLDILGNREVFWENGSNEVVDSNTFEVYEPGRVVLTTVDGRSYELEVTFGITRIEDSNGNNLTIGRNGITHSSGKSIFIDRDGQDRITTITDPNGNTLRYGYDPDGDLVSSTDQVENVTTFTYDQRHNLVEILDPLGNRAVQSEYDSAGRLIAIIDAKGRRTDVAHDLESREERITDGAGNLTRILYDERGHVSSQEQTVTIEGASVPVVTLYEHDSRGNETVVIDPDGLRTESTYENFDLLEEVIDPAGLGIRTTQTFHSRWGLLTRTDPEGNVLSVDYDFDNGNLTSFTDALGNSRNLTYDRRGRPGDVEDALGNVQRATYDSADNVVRHEQLDAGGAVLARTDYTYDANGNRLTGTVFRTIGGVERALTTTFAYDAKGRVVSTTDPLGNVSRVEYNALGLESARVDALGRRTTFSYDEVGALVRTDFPDGTSETIEYDALGNVTRRTNRGGEATLHAYDELRREIRLTGPDGSSTKTIYSPGGRIAAVVDAAGNRTDYEYDSAGRRTRTLGPAAFDAEVGSSVRPETIEEYDQNGRLAGRTDPNGNTTRFVYEGTHHVVRREYADGTTREARYDALDRVVEEIDEAGRSTSFAYDALGRLTAVTDALGGVTTYAHDEAGNLLSQTDARGNTTGYEYDELGRLVRKTLPGGATETLEYDAVGRLVARTDFNGDTVLFTYDIADRLLERLYPDGSKVTFTYTAAGRRQSVTDDRGVTAYQYDAAGRLVRITHPGGETLNYGYDVSGRLASLASPAQTVSYAYDSHGRLAEVGSPDGNAVYGYDRGGRLVRLAAANGIATTWAYDARDRVSEVRHLDGPTPLASFAYDLSPTGRRTRMAELDGSVEAYTYDALDRLVGETRSGTDPRSITYEYDTVGNRTRMVRNGAETTYSYDEDDQLLSAGGATYAYDANGNLTSRADGSDTTAYGWDFDERLVSAVSGSTNAAFEYDADGNRVAIDGPSGSASHLVTPLNPSGLPQVLEERDGSGGLLAAYTYGRDLLAMDRGGVSSFYHYDAHGSTRLLTNAGGSVSDTYVYEGYGSRTSSTGGTTNPYLYTGEQFDSGLGLYHLRARYYDPSTGRFLGRDPFPGRRGDPRTLHPYLYAAADPVNLVDPTGLFFGLGSVLVSSFDDLNQRVTDFSSKGALACVMVNKARAWVTTAFVGAAAHMISTMYDETRKGKVGASFALPIPPILPGGKSLKKITARSFTNIDGDFMLAVGFDLKNGTELRGEWNLVHPEKSSVQAGGGFNIAKVNLCGGVEILALDLKVRASADRRTPVIAAAGLRPRKPITRPASALYVFGSPLRIGLEATIASFIKIQYPLFPPGTHID